MHTRLLCSLFLILISTLVVAAQSSPTPVKGPAKSGPQKPRANKQPKTSPELEELNETNREIASLMKRLPVDEGDINEAMATIKNELKVRELRWRLFERSQAVPDAPFTCYPVQIELFGTYERLMNMLLNFAAFNYLVIIDNLTIRRAKQQAPLVSVEASFTIALYSLDQKARDTLLKPATGDTEAQLALAKEHLAQLSSRFEGRVACWSGIRALGRAFPRSLESVLTEVGLEGDQIKLVGLSRTANTGEQLAVGLATTELFQEMVPEQNGPTFSLKGKLAFDKAYQQWLESDNTDLENLPRDPFTTIYSLDQLTQGSGANANYPPLDKRIEDYLQQINQTAIKRPDRTSPYLVAELSLAGVYYAPGVQGAFFKTPNQKEFYIGVGARCYNGRFTGVQQGRALFEEFLTMVDGKQQTTQVVKTIDTSNCFVVTLPPPTKNSPQIKTQEDAARKLLANTQITFNINNIELRTVLPLLHELSGRRFAYVMDQSVPRMCLSVNRERIPLSDMLIGMLRSVNLSLIAENGLFRIINQEQAEDGQAAAFALGTATTPLPGKFGSKDFAAQAAAIAITDIPLTDVLKFFTANYGVQFVVSDNVKAAKVTATVSEQPWPQALIAILRAARLGLIVDGDRLLVVTRTELLRAVADNKAKLEN